MVNANSLWYRNKAVSYRSEFVYNSPKNSSGWIIAQLTMNPFVLWHRVFLEGRSLISCFLPLCFEFVIFSHYSSAKSSSAYAWISVMKFASCARQLSSTSRSKSKASESLLVSELESLVLYLCSVKILALLTIVRRWNMWNKFEVRSKSCQLLAKRLVSTP